MEASSLLDLQQLDIEHQRRVTGDTGLRLAAVGKVGRDRQATLTTNGHAHDTNVPSADDLATAGGELERLALLVG